MTTPPGPAPPPYGQPPYGPPGGPAYPPGYPPPQKTNWWAIVVCGIVGLNGAKQGQGGRG